jgi:hypothetical protein
MQSILGPAALKQAWEKPFHIQLTGRGIVEVNGTPVTLNDGKHAQLTVYPNGKIERPQP